MVVFAVALTHRTAALGDLERVAVPSAEVAGALARLRDLPRVEGAALLSTCNRTEVYAAGPDPADAAAVARTLERIGGLPGGWVDQRSQPFVDRDAIDHLFLVAAGLDSMVAGESHIQGQVRDAYRRAADLGVLGSELHAVFHGALEAGKRARAAGDLDSARRTIPKAGVEALAEIIGGLEGRLVVVVGAGKMATGTVAALTELGASIRVAARRPEAVAAASPHTCPAVPIDALDRALADADAVVFATSAPHPLLRRARAEAVVAERGGRPLAVLDLGMPRNVDPATRGLPGVTVLDLEALRERGHVEAARWEQELARAREVALAEAERCADRLRARERVDVAAGIQARATDVAAAETARLFRKAPDLDERTRSLVEHAVNRAVRKLLHDPTVRTSEAAARGDEDVLEVARWLFDLDGAARQEAVR